VKIQKSLHQEPSEIYVSFELMAEVEVDSWSHRTLRKHNALLVDADPETNGAELISHTLVSFSSLVVSKAGRVGIT
jgi:hypothetical protein